MAKNTNIHFETNISRGCHQKNNTILEKKSLSRGKQAKYFGHYPKGYEQNIY